MKDFNIELARQGKPVCTRDSKPVRIICFDRAADFCPIVALVCIDGTEQIFSYQKNGSYIVSGEEHPMDLMIAAEKKTKWINIYRKEDGEYAYGGLFDTKKIAVACSKKDDDYVATAEVNWEE